MPLPTPTPGTGRYTLVELPSGVFRLDTQSGRTDMLLTTDPLRWQPIFPAYPNESPAANEEFERLFNDALRAGYIRQRRSLSRYTDGATPESVVPDIDS